MAHSDEDTEVQDRIMSLNEANSRRPNYILGIVGALAGAVLGCAAFWLLMKIGLYAMVVPGAMIGLGCGAQAGGRSIGLGIFAAVFALAFALFVEWYFFPFVADGSFEYFLQNLSDLKPMTKVMIAAGTFAGLWFGRGR